MADDYNNSLFVYFIFIDWINLDLALISWINSDLAFTSRNVTFANWINLVQQYF